jgi:hypothetical protein
MGFRSVLKVPGAFVLSKPIDIPSGGIEVEVHADLIFPQILVALRESVRQLATERKRRRHDWLAANLGNAILLF